MIKLKNPIVAAVKDGEALDKAIASYVQVVFLLYGSISEIYGNIQLLKKAGKRVFVHVEMIEGLRADKAGMEFLAKAGAEGIISTKPAAIKLAASVGLPGVLRIFMIDASAYSTGLRGVASSKPMFAEIMPGVIPEVITEFSENAAVPIAAGGMIRTKEHARKALSSGAFAVTTSNKSLWMDRSFIEEA